MKKLVVVLAVVVSGFVNAQTAEEIEQYKKECNCDEKLAVETHNIVDAYNSWSNSTHTFKTGDNDQDVTIGIGKDIFTDPTAKFKYAKINPRIAQLQVNGFRFGDTISYSKWIASIPVYDINKYEIRYELRDDGNRKMEVIDVFDKTTHAGIRTILIVYLDNSFYSIFDSSIIKK
jgi:hypothetical protein